MTKKKKQIILLTMKFIKEKGFLAFSYDDLAKELGITKAGIHYHFEKKGDLGVAVCTYLEETLEQTYSDIKQETIKTTDKPLVFLSKRAAQVDRHAVCPISALQADYNDLPGTMQEKVRQISQREVRILTELLEDAKQDGGLKAMDDLEGLAALLITSAKGGLQYQRVLGDAFFSKVWTAFNKLLKCD
ncbi:TetR/AcrR family transcriptional regulator [Sediminibacillus halophilus]|uniref:TetR/AcrR family transcriptional regulator, transcriptional repressor for nem operon n=1 Tax=Sediminibacillus halophilus TaxID=482461 RepID=A0A1G9UZM6_9BACI|nr:TetR/AcrR family transcriptional regulator [Sediminibacillus halophilus]SDM65358.1 TetR/AcrR family transcriptional regulator, transcriptional repressor for nem operon [Sediminibacillus halophilus]